MSSKTLIKRVKHRTLQHIMTLDDIRDISIRIVDLMVENKLIPDCTDTDDETEFIAQDIITDVLCKQFNVTNE